MSEVPTKHSHVVPDATILFAGDSGDGMQLTGTQFTMATARALNDLATLPDFPAEIRAPQGTTYGVSGFQLRFGSNTVHTPGDEVDLLVAMNPAALKVNVHRVKEGGVILVDRNAFDQRNLDLAGYKESPLTEALRQKYQLVEVEITRIVREALKETGLNTKDMDRTRNMFALGLSLWLYQRPVEPAVEWINAKFAKKPVVRDANLNLLHVGYNYGETTEQFAARYEVRPAHLPPGTYRAIRGAEALTLGLMAASRASSLPLFYATYPITPASDMLHELAKHKAYGVVTVQAEDEIAAIGAAVGASFGGHLGITGTSGPGMALKTEMLGLAMMMELPLVVINVQRGGPSTGLPTKTEQSDLLQALYGRNGEAPVAVLSASSPGDCFEAAYEACRIAVQHMTPVILLSDGYLANGAAPWRIPNLDELTPFNVQFAKEPNAEKEGEPVFYPYQRNPETLVRPWAVPGTPGLEHRLGGIEKQDGTGNVSYDPANHEHMVHTRANKIARIADTLPPSTLYGASADAHGEILIVGWGSTRGAIELAVDRLQERGVVAAALHLRHLNPLPADLDEIFARWTHLFVPELNNGQLVKVLRDRYLLPFHSITKIQGLPMKAAEIVNAVQDHLSHTQPA